MGLKVKVKAKVGTPALQGKFVYRGIGGTVVGPFSPSSPAAAVKERSLFDSSASGGPRSG